MTDVPSSSSSRHAGPPVVTTALGVVVLILFAASLFLLRTFPLYVDEPQWKLIGSSLFNDNFVLRYFWPACGTGYVLPVPVTWWIPRLIDSLLYGDASNFWIVRPIGIATGLTIMGSIALVFYRTAVPRISLFSAVTIAIALCSFGVLVPLLMMNRPEQSLLIPFMAMMLIYVFRRRRGGAPSLIAAIVWCVVFALLTSMMLAQHIKSFVLLPAAALAAWWTIRRAWPFVVYLGVALFSFFETFSVWEKRTDCPELPHLQDAFNILSISPHMLLTSPALFFRMALQNVTGSWIYILNGFFASAYQSRWLPNDNNNALIENFSNLMLVVALVLLIGVALAGAFRAARSPGTMTQKLADPSTMGLAIVLGLALLLPYQTTKNFYETALFWPLLLLAGALSADRLIALLRRVPRPVIVAGFTAVLVSQGALLVALQSYQDEWQRRAVSDATSQSDAVEVGEACGLKQDKSQTGLVVDNIAHRAYWMTSKPVLTDYVYGVWGRGLDIRAAAKAWPITAIIAQCQAMPEEFRATAKRSADGFYCCAQL